MKLTPKDFELLDCTPPRERKSVRKIADPELFRAMLRDVPESVKSHARHLLSQDWQFLATKQTHGWCRAISRQITIPAWVIEGRYQGIKDPIGYKTWYISHEIAHAYDLCMHKHGPEFMEWLKKICPPEFVHYELGYKPRNAKAAGIGVIDICDLL